MDQESAELHEELESLVAEDRTFMDLVAVMERIAAALERLRVTACRIAGVGAIAAASIALLIVLAARGVL